MRRVMIIFTLDKLLESRGHSFYWLAKETGLHESVLSKYRHNKVRRADVDALNRICTALNCQPGDFVKFELERRRK